LIIKATRENEITKVVSMDREKKKRIKDCPELTPMFSA
jgi:hypothetical protein